MYDIERSLTAVKAFFQASSKEELATVFQEYPELLDENIDFIFKKIIEGFRERNDTKMVQILKQRHKWLKNIRPKFSKFFNKKQDINPLQAAIQQAVQQAVTQALSNYSDLPNHLNNSGNKLIDRYLQFGDPKDLQAGIDAYKQAVDKTLSNSKNLPIYLNNLGIGLRNLYIHSGDLKDLQASINAQKEAIAITPDNSLNLPVYLNNLGNGLRDRYVCLGDLKDLQASIDAHEQAVTKTPYDSPDLPKYLNNLGNALRSRYKQLGNLKDLQTSINIHKKAVAKTPEDAPYLPLCINSLGNGLRERYTRLGDLSDLQASINAHKKAIDKIPSYSPELPGHLSNLGISLRDRYIQLGDLKDLQEGISYCEQAVAKTSLDSSNLPMYLNNLGIALKDRYTNLGNQKDLQIGIKIFQQAIQHGLKVSPLEGFNSAYNWFNWAFERNNWQEMEQPYLIIKKINNKLVEKQLLREYQEAFLKDTQGVAAKIAYARIQTGQLPQAVEALEQGVARLLNAALMRSRADLQQLQHDAPDLSISYQNQLNILQNAQQAHRFATTPERQTEAYQRLKTANQALNDILQRIRQLPGHEKFLLIENELETFYQVVQAMPLVYLLSTEKGGYALVVFQKSNIQAIFLPELKKTTLGEKLAKQERGRWNGYFNAYFSRSHNSLAWFNAIEEITQWLWQVIWQPLSDALLPNYKHITFISIGLLNLLPLHAAWTPDPNRPTGKRYALDEFTITYAPNALSLQKARERATLMPNTLLAVDEPQPVKANKLPYSHIEVNAIAHYFNQPQLFRHQQATVEAIKNALDSNHSVLHFSCHGGANFTNQSVTSRCCRCGSFAMVCE